ncbi:hypothetical protein [Phocaeicola sartorii]|uniref:hypothetical protein n=1 Tax=Phocaeicola sartorii TaxID=671267 RepID=UPI000A668629|nr:hypothetical protein [Phocaeicola sartorii]
MISVDAFKMNKADRTHHQPRTPAPDTSTEKKTAGKHRASGKKRRKVVAAALFTA